jgi:integrase
MRETPGPIKITKRAVDLADSARGRHSLWDSELRGFGVQIEPTGTKTYVVRYRPKGLGRDGPRRFYKIGRHGDLTAEEARLRAKAILGQVADGQDPAANLKTARSDHVRKRDALTVEALGAIFLDEHVKARRKARTAVGYETLLRKHAYPQIGQIKAEALSRVEVARIHASLKASPHTANRVVAVLGSMYSYGQKHALVPESHNPTRGIEKYQEEGRERYLSSVELQRLGSALEEGETIGLPWDFDPTAPTAKHVPKEWKGQREKIDRHAAAAIRLLLLTGARLREILDLRWNHVDPERGLLFLPDSKTGKKTIVLSQAAMAIIEHLSDEDAEGRKRGGYVIKGVEDDKPRHDLKRPWEAVKRHAKLDGVRLHDLRHTFASLGAGASLGLPIVGKLLGHSQPQTTARYAHLDADPLRRASDIIGAQIAKAMAGGPKPRR